MSAHAYVLYIIAFKPFQSAGINSYVLANEAFYSALIIAIFIFSDATPELNIKFGASVALVTSLCLLVLANFLTILVYMIRGPEKLKQDINESKMKRAEKEALERAEEEERKLKKKKEEEEFVKLHDETQNMTNMDASQGTTHGNTTQDLLNTRANRKKSGKSKTKGNDDNVAEGGIAGVNGEDLDSQPKSKHRKRNDKEKAKQDDVVDATIGGGTYEDEKKTKDGKRRKKRKTQGDHTTGTGVAPQTDVAETQNQGKDFF